MRQHERRTAAAAGNGGYPYFKLAAWNGRALTFIDGKVAFPSEQDARTAAKRPGKYRISRVDERGREDLAAFDVA